jgi:hypothetical protein
VRCFSPRSPVSQALTPALNGRFQSTEWLVRGLLVMLLLAVVKVAALPAL